MTNRTVGELRGRRVLVVEDEYYIADDVAKLLEKLGAEVIGPIADLDDAHAILEQEPHIDLAVLDIDLRGDLVYSVAALLQERNVPIIFVTGYDASILPPSYLSVPRLEKPFDPATLEELLLRTLQRNRTPPGEPDAVP
jgi:CheY-like chemotaxis protein